MMNNGISSKLFAGNIQITEEETTIIMQIIADIIANRDNGTGNPSKLLESLNAVFGNEKVDTVLGFVKTVLGFVKKVSTK